MVANNLNLGRLPTLGLGKIRAEDFADDTANPFKVQDNTEKLLVMRELEREFKDMNRYEKDSQRIFQKGVQSKPDRTGSIRDVQGIHGSKENAMINHKQQDIIIMLNEMKKRKTKQTESANSEETRENANKQKINIFDTQDSTILKHETLARLGYDEKALVPVDQKSDTVSLRSSNDRSTLCQRPKAIEYLNKCRQQKETVRDFIENSRKISMAGLSIIDKTEETELLKEYIIMEKEKLDEGKKTFQEDQDIYEKVKIDLQTKSQQTENDCRDIQKTNETLQNKYNDLKKARSEVANLGKKC